LRNRLNGIAAEDLKQPAVMTNDGNVSTAHDSSVTESSCSTTDNEYVCLCGTIGDDQPFDDTELTKPTRLDLVAIPSVTGPCRATVAGP
jgi:hypothetical protein